MAAIPTLAPRFDVEWHFASFWERLGATLIDLVVLLTLSFVLLVIELPFVAATGQALLPWVPPLIYWWVSNAYGKSPGKDAMGIEIVNAQWRRPGVAAGFVRWFISNVSALVIGLGYFSVFWDRDRRAWHDHAAGVWVVVKGTQQPTYEPLTRPPSATSRTARLPHGLLLVARYDDRPASRAGVPSATILAALPPTLRASTLSSRYPSSRARRQCSRRRTGLAPVTVGPADRGNAPLVAAADPARAAYRRKWLAPVALGLLGSIAGLLLFTALQPRPEPLGGANLKAAVASAAASAVASAAAAPAQSTAVFRTILPSLVLIRTEGNEDDAEGTSVGSGVIINADGLILTAHHVVQGAREISVTFADGTSATAEVAATQPNDLAVLRANGAPEIIVPAVLGGAGLRIGDNTFAIGNPLGLAGSFSAGVISGLDRTIPLPHGAGVLTGLIQFDAAVNPGSSGGPLLNRDGQVIGIVTALANPSSEKVFTGIGFAVPLGTAGGGLGGPPR